MRANYQEVRKILCIILLANVTVALIKLTLGFLIKSTSLVADGFHSLSDGTSNLVGLVGIQIASRPEDKNHPYGHIKFEMLSGLLIATLLFAVGLRVVMNAILAFYKPYSPQITAISVMFILITLVVNILVSWYEYKKGKELDSIILVSDSIHTRSDIYISAGVILSLIGIKVGLPSYIDPIVSFIIGLFIFHASYEIFRENSNILLDRVVVDTEEVRNIVMSFEPVKNTHNIRSRGCKNKLYIDMHLMVEPNLNVEESHKLVHEIEKRIKVNLNQSAQVIIHLEPYIDESSIESHENDD